MDTAETTMDTAKKIVFVYIQNLPKDVTGQTLADYFNRIGILFVSACPNLILMYTGHDYNTVW